MSFITLQMKALQVRKQSIMKIMKIILSIAHNMGLCKCTRYK